MDYDEGSENRIVIIDYNRGIASHAEEALSADQLTSKVIWIVMQYRPSSIKSDDTRYQWLTHTTFG